MTELKAHPNADKLTVCEVDAGTGARLNIVCGAPNVAAGIRVPCALEGAVLPGDFRIRRTTMCASSSPAASRHDSAVGVSGAMSAQQDDEIATLASTALSAPPMPSSTASAMDAVIFIPATKTAAPFAKGPGGMAQGVCDLSQGI